MSAFNRDTQFPRPQWNRTGVRPLYTPNRAVILAGMKVVQDIIGSLVVVVSLALIVGAIMNLFAMATDFWGCMLAAIGAIFLAMVIAAFFRDLREINRRN
jgi:hypothetical protein